MITLNGMVIVFHDIKIKTELRVLSSDTTSSHAGFSERQVSGDVQVSLEVCEGKLRFTVMKARYLKTKSTEKHFGNSI